MQVPFSYCGRLNNLKNGDAECKYPRLLIKHDHIHVHRVIRLEVRN